MQGRRKRMLNFISYEQCPKRNTASARESCSNTPRLSGMCGYGGHYITGPSPWPEMEWRNPYWVLEIPNSTQHAGIQQIAFNLGKPVSRSSVWDA